MHAALRYALLALAVARGTRFFTADSLGGWVAVDPAMRWAAKHEDAARRRAYAAARASRPGQPMPPYEHWEPGATSPLSWQGKLVKGLDCPFCVGFHVGWLALLGEATLGRIPVVRVVWRFGVAAFALNYLVGHVSAKLDS